MDGKQKKIRSWIAYDWANSAFATTIMAAVLPTYYSTVAGATLPKAVATSYWGYTNTAAMLCIALTAPLLGTLSDQLGKAKRFLAIFAFLGIFSTAFLVTVGRGDWLSASLFFFLGRIGFGAGNIFYNSLLPHIAEKGEMDRVSTAGYAWGYLGGGLLLLVNLTMIMKPEVFGIADGEWGSRLSFLTAALWWLLFSIPLFKNIPEPARSPFSGSISLLRGFERLMKTFREVRKYKELFKFLIAFWLYNDAIGTIIIMAVIFGTEIGIGQTHLIGSILMVQFLGLPFTLLFGKAAEVVGAKKGILAALAVYTAIVILGYFMDSPLHFWILAFLVATVQGGAQALSRSLYGKMVPREKSAEFFGFYDMSNKFGGIFGPLLFAAMSQWSGSSRYGIIALIFFFLAGGILLWTVKEKR